MEEECTGGGNSAHEPGADTPCGGKQGRASVNGSPDSCGIHSLKPLLGVIDTALLRWYFSARQKSPFFFLFPPSGL